VTNSSAVLAIVDVQNGFITEHSRSVVPIIADLVARWQAKGGDTLFTRYLNYPGSPFERLLDYTDLHSEPETALACAFHLECGDTGCRCTEVPV
jgi:nicotinamidase-related amidase